MRFIGALHPVPPYNFEHLLAILSRFTDPVLNIAYENALWRVVRIQDVLVLVKVVSSGTANQPALDVFQVLPATPIDDAAILTALEHILGIGMDLSEFYAIVESEQILSQIIQPLYGLPTWRSASVFEALISLIIEQQISWVAAQRAQHQLMVWAGDGLPIGDKMAYTFPTPQQIAEATIDDLKPLKITTIRMKRMIQIAEEICAGNLDIETVRQMSPEEAYDSLMKIKGVGHWTAANTLGRALGVYQYVGHNDVALQAAVNAYFFQQEGRTTAEVVHDLFAGYGAYAGLAGHFTLLRWVLDEYPVQNTM